VQKAFMCYSGFIPKLIAVRYGATWQKNVAKMYITEIILKIKKIAVYFSLA
jgi:hypothetical protein